MKVAVVGHLEWCHFSKVSHVPAPSEIVNSQATWDEVGGGGAVAAMQLYKMAGNCIFITAIGNDDVGRKCIEQLTEFGIEVYSAKYDNQKTKESFINIDANKERSITVAGSLEPSGNDDSLPWSKLAEVDAVYFVGGDSSALNYARKSKILVSTARTLSVLKSTPIQIDALVMSNSDQNEKYKTGDLEYPPKNVVVTNGKSGGITEGGIKYNSEIVPFDKIKDTYGCGDSFAAGLTYGLGKNMPIEVALGVAAHCGAMAAQRQGAFYGQIL